LLVGLTAATAPVRAICARSSVQVDAVGVHRALAQQAEVAIHSQVAARLRKQLVGPADFVKVFGHVRLDPHVRVLGGQCAGAAQLFVRAGGRKTRCDGVAQAVHAVPALDQVFGVDQALFGLVAHAVRAVAVLQHLAGDETQPRAFAASNAAFTDVACEVAKASAVVTPLRSNSSKKNSATSRGVV
jgi:hypothetical protein